MSQGTAFSGTHSIIRRGDNIDTQIPYQIRRSNRAKRVRLVVTPHKVEVVAPFGTDEKDLHAFVQRSRDWIEKTRHRMNERMTDTPSLAPAKFDEGAQIPYKGTRWPLTVIRAPVRRSSVSFAESFVVSVPSHISETQREEAVRKALTTWLKTSALHEANTFSGYHGPRFALFPRSVRIREQRTRWGSCGIRNDINLNWRLIFAPMSVLEYVVVHELCHIRHRNHSRDFWELVEAHLPHYRRERSWLRQHGARLMGDF